MIARWQESGFAWPLYVHLENYTDVIGGGGMNPYLKTCICFLLFLCLIPGISASGGITLTGTELLGRPTDYSMALNVVANAGIEAYVEYVTASGAYTNKTKVVAADAGESLTILINQLAPNHLSAQ